MAMEDASTCRVSADVLERLRLFVVTRGGDRATSRCREPAQYRTRPVRRSGDDLLPAGNGRASLGAHHHARRAFRLDLDAQGGRRESDGPRLSLSPWPHHDPLGRRRSAGRSGWHRPPVVARIVGADTRTKWRQSRCAAQARTELRSASRTMEASHSRRKGGGECAAIQPRYNRGRMRWLVALPVILLVAWAQSAADKPAADPSALENAGKPMAPKFQCTEEDIQSFGLGCTEDEPCSIYMELS